MTMDPSMPNKGEFLKADVLVEGKKIVAVGPNLQAGGAAEIDARGKIVMPGFIDTHHHQFETALRSFLANGVLINDQSGSASANPSYFEFILLTFAPVYRPEDVYISELFGGLSQLDDGVTTVHDVSQIHHSPDHSDAAIKALFDTGRRAAFGFFESAGANILGTNPGNKYPSDAPRIKKQWFSSSDQLVHMNMRHGMPPIVRMQQMGLEPSLSTDVEVTMTADFFTQMRVGMNLQRMVVNQMILDSPNGNQNLPDPRNWELPQTAVPAPGFFFGWPTPPAGIPAPLTARDALRFATINGAKHLRLDKKTGSLTPGKEADIIILDATAMNVAPLNNVPGAVVSLMDRTNVETVIVAGKVRKWKGKLLDVDLNNLRRQLENSRDDIFAAAKVPQDLYR